MPIFVSVSPFPHLSDPLVLSISPRLPCAEGNEDRKVKKKRQEERDITVLRVSSDLSEISLLAVAQCSCGISPC